jgi:hypothetical protein
MVDTTPSSGNVWEMLLGIVGSDIDHDPTRGDLKGKFGLPSVKSWKLKAFSTQTSSSKLEAKPVLKAPERRAPLGLAIWVEEPLSTVE